MPTRSPFANLGKTFARFFNEEPRRPRFKKKGKSRDAFYVANDKFRVDDKAIMLPRIGKVRMCEALRFQGKVTGATVSRAADRRFVAISVEVELPVARCENQARTVGVDLGVSRRATLSDVTPVEGPKPLRGSLRRLARLNRGLHRKVTGSNNRAKAAMRVARCHARVMRMRNDALHKLTTGLVRNRKLPRVISDMGFGEFRRQLSYKVVPSLTKLVVADRWYPSSKLFLNCGTLHDGLTLKDRTFTCDGCGHVEDRDLHAARNLERYPGLQGNLDACGHLSAGQPTKVDG